MRNIAMPITLSLLVVAALCSTPSVASGTALCEDKPVTEPVSGACGLPYGSGTVVTGTASNAVLEAGKVVDKCGKSTIEGKLSEGSTGEGKALKASITSMTFSGCGCTTTEALHLPYNASLSWTSAANGKMTLESSGKGSPAIKTTCSGLSCAYSATAPSVEVIGGEPAKIEFKVTLTANEEEAGCKVEKALYTASYSLTQPNSGKAFVANLNTPVIICKVAGQNPCTTDPYPTPVTLEAVNEGGVSFELKYNEGGMERGFGVTCNASSLIAETLLAGWPLRGSTKNAGLTFSTCPIGCVVEAKRLQYIFKLDALPMGKASFEMEAGINGPPAILIKCNGFPECTYSTGTIPGTIINGAPAKLAIANVAFNTLVAGPAECRGIVWTAGNYKFTKPETGTPASPQMWVRRQGVL